MQLHEKCTQPHEFNSLEKDRGSVGLCLEVSVPVCDANLSTQHARPMIVTRNRVARTAIVATKRSG